MTHAAACRLFLAGAVASMPGAPVRHTLAPTAVCSTWTAAARSPSPSPGCPAAGPPTAKVADALAVTRAESASARVGIACSTSRCHGL